MTIRQATIEDLPLLETCAREFYASSKHLRDFELSRFVGLWTSLIAGGTGVIFILAAGGDIAGAIGGISHPDAYSALIVAQEFFWFVRSELRGGGVRLYRAFEQWAKDRGCGELHMAYLPDSMPGKVAIFYEKMGFRLAEVAYAKGLA